MSKYDKLPNAPEHISASAVMMRFVDGLGFRYATATHDLRPNFIEFKACDTAMSVGELLKHIYQLTWWVVDSFDIDNPYDKTLDTVEAYRTATLQKVEVLSDHLSKCTDEDLDKSKLYLKREDMNYPFWYMINGPLADIVSHIGQINSWRRMADNPVQRISPLNGKPR